MCMCVCMCAGGGGEGRAVKASGERLGLEKKDPWVGGQHSGSSPQTMESSSETNWPLWRGLRHIHCHHGCTFTQACLEPFVRELC